MTNPITCAILRAAITLTTSIVAVVAITLATLTACTRKELVPMGPVPVVISDPVFRAYCLSAKDIDGNPTIDLDGDGVITTDEAAQVGEIYLDNEGGGGAAGVQSLAGIEHFTGLRRLGVATNRLTSLDLSHNPALTYLNCGANRLTSLDLSHNLALETVNCIQNDLTSLNVSGLVSLKYLYCAGNAITSLDLSHSSALIELSCDRNKLTTLDVGGCSALTDLYCAGNGLTSLSLPTTSALVRLDCGTHEHNKVSIPNKLPQLDLSGQDKLSLLRVNSNPLTSLDLIDCATLRTLECVDCALTELDIRPCERLRLLFCNGNPAGMRIIVPPGFTPSRFLSWVIGSATVVEL